MYLEPTTGRIYSVKRCPYLKIDLIWNHRNLWVNMQARVSFKQGTDSQIASMQLDCLKVQVCGASHVQLDLYNSRYFEYVMPGAYGPNGRHCHWPMDPGSSPCCRDEKGQRKHPLPRLDADNPSGDLGSGGRYEGDDTGNRENRINLQLIAADVRHEAFQESRQVQQQCRQLATWTLTRVAVRSKQHSNLMAVVEAIFGT